GPRRRGHSHYANGRCLPAGGQRSDSYRAVSRGREGPDSAIRTEAIAPGEQVRGCVEGEMKVGSMKRGKRILLVTTTLLLAVTGAQAGLWRSRKPQPSPDANAVQAAMALTAIEADGGRVMLRTSGTPVYTSYSPSPDVFVI